MTFDQKKSEWRICTNTELINTIKITLRLDERSTSSNPATLKNVGCSSQT